VANAAPSGATLLYVGNGHDTSRNAPRELFAIDDQGGTATRLTACATRSPLCEVVEVAPAPDRSRVAMRRRSDADHNGVLVDAEEDGIYVVDLVRGVEGRSIQRKGISGLDWSPIEEKIAYSALGEGGLEDLFKANANGSEDGNQTATPDASERRFRYDPQGRNLLVYERTLPGQRGEIWLFRTALLQGRLTMTGSGSPTELLPGTPYRIGSDADPDFSPDLSAVVFRHLVGPGDDNRGSWDLMTINTDGTNLRTISSGAAYRGAPDWGPRGIVFTETPAGSSTTSLVVVDGNGGARRVVLSQSSAFALESPRWLP
jgi:Tol biopolymer transport system component